MTTQIEVQPIVILLVEDSPSDAHLAIEALGQGSVPHAVHHVFDGVDAVAFLRKEAEYHDAPRPDVILLDLNLPRMDGHEVLSVLRGDELLGGIPTVVLSASTDPADVEGALNRGAAYYISKPTDMIAFAEAIQKFQSAVTLQKRFGVSLQGYLGQQIKELDLTDCQLADQCLEHLEGLGGLESLCLSGTSICGPGLKYLARHRGLRHLNLDFTSVDDESLKHLERLESLESLSLQATRVTPTGVEKLRTALPNTSIQT